MIKELVNIIHQMVEKYVGLAEQSCETVCDTFFFFGGLLSLR